MAADDLKSLDEEQQNLFEKLNSASREVSFLFGAGTSVPAKLPDMYKLTSLTEAEMNKSPTLKDVFANLKGQLGAKQHIEHILSFLEQISEIKGFSNVLYTGGKAPHDWSALASEIKKTIATIIESQADLESKAHRSFANWIGSRAGETEVYTLNYDLVVETAFENANVFYFDGFVGGIRPVFQTAAVDPVLSGAAREVRPPKSWVRYWKMHGSINWEAKDDNGRLEVRRNPDKSDACLIYPSSNKYSDSRRLPYVVLQDKFRRSLVSGSKSLVVLGYGFGDEHINEIIYDSLDRNNNLDVNVLSFTEIDDNSIVKKMVQKRFLNLTVFTPKTFIHQGVVYKWDENKECKFGDAAVFFEALEKTISISPPLVSGTTA